MRSEIRRSQRPISCYVKFSKTGAFAGPGLFIRSRSGMLRAPRSGADRGQRITDAGLARQAGKPMGRLGLFAWVLQYQGFEALVACSNLELLFGVLDHDH